MKNKIHFRKLGRTSSHRKALFRNMVTALIDHERIRTTLAKAKEMRRIGDRVIGWAKSGTYPSRQRALGYVRTPAAVTKLFSELGPRYKDRLGGYVRVLRCGFRTGDRAPMAILEYVDRPGEVRLSRPVPGTPLAAALERAQAYRSPSVLAAAAAASTRKTSVQMR